MLGFGLLCGALSFALYAVAPTTMFFLIGIPFGALWGLAGPAEQALMSREVGAEEQGFLQGAAGGLRGVAGMTGPLIFSQVFAASVAAAFLPGAAFLLSALLLLASLAVAFRGRPAN